MFQGLQGKEVRMERIYYPDGVTRIADPFYKCVCRKCRHFFWAVTNGCRCPECGSDDVFRSFDKGEAVAEIERLRESG